MNTGSFTPPGTLNDTGRGKNTTLTGNAATPEVQAMLEKQKCFTPTNPEQDPKAPTRTRNGCK